MSRPLTPNELAAIEWVIAAHSRDAAPLRAQVETLTATPVEQCPCDLSLTTPGPAQPGVANGPLRGPIVVDADGEPTGHIDLWVKDGLLSALEYSWFQEMPTTYPPAERLRAWPSNDIRER
ncbi:MAG TPA: hypothetical protein VF494_11150 [Candidatus Limnocylindrales bacterium]